MSPEMVHCTVCNKLASVYAIVIPNIDRKTCSKCGHSYDPTERKFFFCSWLCLTEFVKANADINKFKKKE